MRCKTELHVPVAAWPARNLVPAPGDDGATAGETPQWVGGCFFSTGASEQIGDMIFKYI